MSKRVPHVERELRAKWSQRREANRRARIEADPEYAARRKAQLRAAWQRQPDEVRRETRRGA